MPARVQECEIPQYDPAGHFSVEKMREKRYMDYFYVLGRSLTAHFDVQETLWIP